VSTTEASKNWQASRLGFQLWDIHGGISNSNFGFAVDSRLLMEADFA
jgi:hypothetical protein